MSVDNVIYVQRRGGWWKVWEDSASNEYPKPDSNCARFVTRRDALEFAHNWALGDGPVEYGVQELRPQDPQFGAE